MNRKGFTVVELLIVIVVIAILAAISIVAFVGIQDRALNTAKIQAAQQLAKAFDVAVLRHEVNLGAHAPYCLPTGLSDINGDGRPPCGYTASDNAYFRAEKTAANTMLQNAGLTDLNFPESEVSGNNNVKYRGIQVTYGSGAYGVDGVQQPYFLYFFLKGANQDCSSGYSIGPKNGNDNATNPLHAYTRAPYFASNNGITTCAYTIRHPNSM